MARLCAWKDCVIVCTSDCSSLRLYSLLYNNLCVLILPLLWQQFLEEEVCQTAGPAVFHNLQTLYYFILTEARCLILKVFCIERWRKHSVRHACTKDLKDMLQTWADWVMDVSLLSKSHIAKILYQVLGSSTGWKSIPDDRHGLTTDLNSNTGRHVSDLCLTPSGVKTTRPAPLINVMFSLFLVLPLSVYFSIQPRSGY